MEIKGLYDTAIVYTDNIEQQAIHQIKTLMDQPMSLYSHTRIMPDVHAGAGCVIGYTAKLTDKIVPNLIGVDIGCGVLAVNLPISYERIKDNLEALDLFVRNEIPSGREINKCQQSFLSSKFTSKVKEVCANTGQDFNYVINSLGSLGGGNHFIEIDKNETDDCWLLVHSGSRNFGLKIANFHQRKAKERNFKEERSQLIAELKSQYTGEELGKKIAEIKIKKPETGLEFLEGSDLEDYAFDMTVAQEFASINRKMIALKILRFFNLDFYPAEGNLSIESVHNYIDFDQEIIRKGAIDASKGEKVVIPLNMRDGVILGIGKGNEDWNFSAPHGSGRTMSRTEARKTLSLTKFQEEMDRVYSTSVSEQTIDEAPEAYKPSEEIIKYLEPTVEVKERLYPIWNFKALE